MKTFIRHCPKCKISIKHINERSCKTAKKEKHLCRQCQNLQISKLFIGQRHSTATEFKKGCSGYNSSNIPKNNLDPLLQCTPKSFYWLGFILADGSFYKTIFELTLANKDRKHLQLFSNFINFKGKIKKRVKQKYVKISFANKFSLKEVMKSYGIKYRKTYNPPPFTRYKKFSNNMLSSMLIGLIDGDGYIGTNGSKNARIIKIQVHITWYLFYTSLFKKLKLAYTTKTHNNLVLFRLYRGKTLQYLYNKAIINKIPILKRKWNLIKDTTWQD